MPILRPVPLALSLCLLSLLATPAGAQTKPAASKTISGNAATGKLMTFKELESCLKEYDGLQPQAQSINQRREAMEAERKQIDAEGAAIRNDPRRAALVEKLNEFNTRQQAINARAEAFKARNEALKNGQFKGNSSEERDALERERVQLVEASNGFNAESARLGTERDALVAELKQRGDAHSAKADDWNARSKVLDGEAQAFDTLRQAWSDRCGNRPYNEEHEKIIRSGK